MPVWKVYHVDSGVNADFKNTIESLINNAGPASGAVQAGLSAGRDFWIWYREDNQSARWTLRIINPAITPSWETVMSSVIENGGCIVGFNKQNELWYLQRS